MTVPEIIGGASAAGGGIWGFWVKVAKPFILRKRAERKKVLL